MDINKSTKLTLVYRESSEVGGFKEKTYHQSTYRRDERVVIDTYTVDAITELYHAPGLGVMLVHRYMRVGPDYYGDKPVTPLPLWGVISESVPKSHAGMMRLAIGLHDDYKELVRRHMPVTDTRTDDQVKADWEAERDKERAAAEAQEPKAQEPEVFDAGY